MLSSDVGIRLAATHEEDKPGMEAVDLGPLPFVPAVYLEARTTSSSSVSLHREVDNQISEPIANKRD